MQHVMWTNPTYTKQNVDVSLDLLNHFVKQRRRQQQQQQQQKLQHLQHQQQQQQQQ